MEVEPTRNSYRAKFTCEQTDPKGVALCPGDKVTDVVDLGSGWVACYNKNTGKTGVCPSDFLQKDMARIRSLSLSKFRNRVSSVSINIANSSSIHTKNSLTPEKQLIEDKILSKEKPHDEHVPLSPGRRILHITVGLFGGAVLGGLLLVVLYCLYDFTFKEAVGVSGAITLIMGLGLIFSQHVRCVAVLMGVSMFTNQGRVALLSLVPGLILAGPIMNMHGNINEGVNSVACVGQVLYNHSNALQQNTLEFLVRQQKILEEGEKKINEEISNLTTNIYPGASTNKTKECFERLKRMKLECQEAVNQSKQECEDASSNTGKFLSFSCKSNCKVLSSAVLCSHLNETICTSSRRSARSVINSPKQLLGDTLKRELGFRVNVSRVLDINTNNSFNPAEKILEVKKKIQGTMDQVIFIFRLINKILIIFIIWAFISACLYLRKYLKKVTYDNIYITSGFKNLNSKLRKIEKRKAVLPLEKKEKKKYVDSTSTKPGRAEAFAWTMGITRVVFHIIIAAVVILMDFALFYVLQLINENGGSDILVSGGAALDVDVEGVGPLAEFVRNIYAGNTASNKFESVLNFDQCLPSATAPSWNRVYTIIALYVVTLLFVLFQSVGLRLRRKISAFFFPQRETERIHYLYRHILLKRRMRAEERKKLDLLKDEWGPFLQEAEYLQTTDL